MHGVLQSNFVFKAHAQVTVKTQKKTKYAIEIAELNRQISELIKACDTIEEQLRQEVDKQKHTHQCIILLQTFINEKRKSIQHLGGNLMTLEQARYRLRELRQNLAVATSV